MHINKNWVISLIIFYPTNVKKKLLWTLALTNKTLATNLCDMHINHWQTAQLINKVF